MFGGISKFFELIVFGQILVVLGWFYYIGYGWEHAQTWAKILKTPLPFNSESKHYI